jgi:hypothetical protein
VPLSVVTSSDSISPSPHYWTWYPFRRGRGRTEARSGPCAQGRWLGCAEVGRRFGCSGKGAKPLIFVLYPASRLLFVILVFFSPCIDFMSAVFPATYPPYDVPIFGIDSHCIPSSKVYSNSCSILCGVVRRQVKNEHFI